MRTDPKAAFERLPLVAAADPATFEGGAVPPREDRPSICVESNGVRSPIFSLSVVNLPTVSAARSRIPLPVLHRASRRASEEGGGDVAAIRGTDVLLHIAPTMDARRAGGSCWTTARRSRSTTQADGTLTGSFKIDRAGVLQDRADRPARREGGRVAAVHDRRASTISRRRCASASRGATRRRARSKNSSSRRAADDDYGVKTSAAVLLGERRRRRRRCRCSAARSRCTRSRAPATRSISRSWV